MERPSGITLIAVTYGSATVIPVDPLTDPDEAVIVAAPCVTACTRPVELT